MLKVNGNLGIFTCQHCCQVYLQTSTEKRLWRWRVSPLLVAPTFKVNMFLENAKLRMERMNVKIPTAACEEYGSWPFAGNGAEFGSSVQAGDESRKQREDDGSE